MPLISDPMTNWQGLCTSSLYFKTNLDIKDEVRHYFLSKQKFHPHSESLEVSHLASSSWWQGSSSPLPLGEVGPWTSEWTLMPLIHLFILTLIGDYSQFYTNNSSAKSKNTWKWISDDCCRFFAGLNIFSSDFYMGKMLYVILSFGRNIVTLLISEKSLTQKQKVILFHGQLK